MFNRRKPRANIQKTIRKYHKWLMAFLGIQFVVWSITGAYMVLFDIDYIHGNDLVENHQTFIPADNINVSLNELANQYPKLNNISLNMLVDRPVYRFNIGTDNYLVDAASGQQLSPLSQQLAIQVARHQYTGTGHVISAQLVEENPPYELSARHLPAWRVDFDDFGSPSIYISATYGQVVTKRHQWWRLFDWVFRFHVMDYQDSEVDNNLLFTFALLGILAGMSGMFLVYFRLFNGKKRRY